MGHKHSVYDSDTHFSINPITRVIRNDASRKTVLIQGDHNSERFTFELPRHIEGHDMSACDVVEVHYLNIASDKKDQKSGVYTVEDLQVSPDDDQVVVCSWLISQNATQLVGSLNFLLRFRCVENDLTTYVWNTAVHDGIRVSDGINGGETLEADYLDIIEQWKASVIREITNDVNAGVSAWAETESGKIRGLVLEETTKTNAALAVERARIDLMQSEATVDDAELIDIRVGADGVTYPSAGTAVRRQLTIFDAAKQQKYGSFVPVDLVINEDTVFQVPTKTTQPQSGGRYAEYTVTNEVMLLISGFSWSSYSSFPLGAFYDVEGNLIAKIGDTTSEAHTKELHYVPTGAVKLVVNGNVWNNPAIEKFVPGDLEADLASIREKLTTLENIWCGKKVVWIGTSVSFGQHAEAAYPHEAAKKLGFELVNCSVPGLAIHTTDDGAMLQYGSLALSKAEYTGQGWTIPDEPIAYTPGGNCNNHYRTYENIFCADNADADLYVFDVAPNNINFSLTDWNAFDHVNWCYADGSDFADHRSTFLGALLFLMDKMYSLNENARMVFVLGSAFAYWECKAAFQTVKDKWNIPIIDLWGKVNTSPKSVSKLKSNGGTDWHPSTFAHELMGRMLADDIQSIS